MRLFLLSCLTFLGCSLGLAQTGSVVTVNSDNVLVINGRTVFPIGFSPGPPINGKTPTGDDAMQEFRNAGALLFRMVQTNNWDSSLIAQQQAALDWAAQHGMYIWLNLREFSQFASTDTNTPVNLKNLVDTFRNHPGLGLWKNFDEAWWGGISVSNLLNGYNVIKQEDTNHPIVQTHAPRGYVTNLQPYNVAADVLAVDIYPVAIPAPSNPPPTNTQISVVGDWAQEIAQVANGQKQFWLIEQIAFSGTTPPAKTLTFPTFTQSRYMAYQAINNGARGMMFFGGNVAATLTNAQDAALQWNWTFWTNVLKQVVQQLGDHGPLANALAAPNSTLPITISGSGFPDLEYCVRETPPYLFILASKREGTNATVTFSGLPGWAGTGEVLYESPRTVTASGGQFTDTFTPFDVHVYRFAQSNVPPTVLYSPFSRTNSTGTTAAFTVYADGTAPLTYQWRKNGTNLSDGGAISGAATSDLALSPVSFSDGATYTVVVSGFGSVTSTPAVLTVTNVPPFITSQPQSTTNSAGTTATFTVRADGGGALGYQWRRSGTNLTDGGNVSGATSNSLSLGSVTIPDTANYDVVVTGFGSVTSALVSLTVVLNPLILYEPFSYANIGGPASSNAPANWTYNGGGGNDLNMAGASLSYSGLMPPAGNSVTNGGDGLGVRRLFGTSISTGKLYFSALFRMNNLGYSVWSGSTAAAGVQVGALTATDNQSFRLAVMVKSNSPTGFLIGVQKGGTGVSSTYDTTERHAGETIFLVGRYDFTVSSNAVSLWINPSPSLFGSATDPVSGFITASTGTDGFVIDRFNMRQNTAVSVPAEMQWDELRFGTSWAVVTPPPPALLTGMKKLGNGAFQFAYTNNSAQSNIVYASSNLVNWAAAGVATQISSGVYQFTDPTATNYSRRFYKLR